MKGLQRLDGVDEIAEPDPVLAEPHLELNRALHDFVETRRRLGEPIGEIFAERLRGFVLLDRAQVPAQLLALAGELASVVAPGGSGSTLPCPKKAPLSKTAIGPRSGRPFLTTSTGNDALRTLLPPASITARVARKSPTRSLRTRNVTSLSSTSPARSK